MVFASAVMGCGTRYGSVTRVGSQCLADAFAALGLRIGYLSNPVSPWHLLGSRDAEVAARFRAGLRGWEHHQDLASAVPLALATPRKTPLLRSRWLARHWQSLTLRDPVRRLASIGLGGCDLLYLDSPYFGFLTARIKHQKFVYRMADALTGFSAIPDSLAAIERALVAQADLVVTPTAVLRDSALALGARQALLLPNGVDPERFTERAPVPAEYAHIPEPRAIYLGTLAEWLDHDALNRLAADRPRLSIVIIGHGPAAPLIARLPNVHLLGTRQPATIAAYLQHAQVGLIPFAIERCRDLVNASHPIKLFEYLACGLPVATAAWPALAHLAPPRTVLADGSLAPATVDAALALGRDPHACDRFLAQHTWRARASDILAVVCPTPRTPDSPS